MKTSSRPGRSVDRHDLFPRLDLAHARDVDDVSGRVSRPTLPGSSRGVTGLEHQGSSGPEGCPDPPQRCDPVVVGLEDLGDVGGHEGCVDAQWRQRGGIAEQPRHPVGVRLGPSDIQRGASGVDGCDVHASPDQHAREGAGAAADVEHRPDTQLCCQGDVDVEVATVGIERVVDRGQARVVEDRIGHHTSLVVDDPGGRTRCNSRGSDQLDERHSGVQRHRLPGRRVHERVPVVRRFARPDH